MGLLNQVYLTNDLMNWADWLNDICILRVMDIHWNYQNLLFWAGIVWHRLSANQIVRCFKLKKLKNYMRYQVDFLLPLKLQKYAILGYATKYSWPIILQDFLLLLWPFNLNTGGPLLHYICWFSNVWIGFEANHGDT